MSRNDTWMPLYIGDYLADTMHLNTAEHGAYVLLIMHYWRNGPLPDDDKFLASVARAERRHWAEMSAAIRGFFVPKDGKLYHKRIERERDRAGDVANKRSEAGRRGASSRWGIIDGGKSDSNTHGPANGTANSKQDGKRMANATNLLWQNDGQSQSQSQVPPQGRKNRPFASLTPSAGAEAERDFERFWAAYPRKVGKGQARKAFDAAMRKTTLDAILFAIQRTRWSDDPRFQPHPSTWLTGERWLDQADDFDPVLRAVGLSPEDFDDLSAPTGGLLQ